MFKLTRGKHWWPLGRKYEVTESLVEVVDGITIAVFPGLSFDGPTNWPVRSLKSPMLYMSAFHDPDNKVTGSKYFLISKGGQTYDPTRHENDAFAVEVLRRRGASLLWCWVIRAVFFLTTWKFD